MTPATPPRTGPPPRRSRGLILTLAGCAASHDRQPHARSADARCGRHQPRHPPASASPSPAATPSVTAAPTPGGVLRRAHPGRHDRGAADRPGVHDRAREGRAERRGASGRRRLPCRVVRVHDAVAGGRQGDPRAHPDAVQALATPEATAGVGFFVRRQPGRWPDPGSRRCRVRRHPVGARPGSDVRRDPPAEGGTVGEATGAGRRQPRPRARRRRGAARHGRGRTPRSASSTANTATIRRPPRATWPPSSPGWSRPASRTSAKHFPGLGRVAGNTDFTGDVVDSVTEP